MTVWVVDDGPLGDLAQHFSATWNWPAHLLHTVDEVAIGASRDKSGRRQALLAMRQGNEPVLEVHALIAGSEAAQFLFGYLRPKAASATKHLGEDAAISYCAIDRTDGVFVAFDKGAAFLALAELGRTRVATPFDLWDDLFSQGLIAKAEFDSLCDRAYKRSSLPGVPRRILR